MDTEAKPFKIIRRPTDMPRLPKIHWLLYDTASSVEEAEQKISMAIQANNDNILAEITNRKDWDIVESKKEEK